MNQEHWYPTEERALKELTAKKNRIQEGRAADLTLALKPFVEAP